MACSAYGIICFGKEAATTPPSPCTSTGCGKSLRKIRRSPATSKPCGATAIRTIVVLVFSWLMVFLVGSQTQIASISGGTWLFLVLSGLPIDKLSILVTVAFSYFVFHERLSKKSGVGLALVVAGTLAMLF